MNHVLANLADAPEGQLFLDGLAAVNARDGVCLEDANTLCIEPLRCSAVAGDLLKKLRHAYHALLDNVFHDCDEPDFGISEFERALRRRRLRARLWRGSGRYRRGKVPLLQ